MTDQKNVNLDEDALELLILEKFVDHFNQVYYQQKLDNTTHNKCDRELDMGEVLHEITGWEGRKLEAETVHWFGSLVSNSPSYRDKKPLRPCSDRESRGGPHKWHARSYEDGTGAVPTKERVRELRKQRQQQVSQVSIDSLTVEGVANIGGHITDLSVSKESDVLKEIAETLRQQAAQKAAFKVRLRVKNKSSGSTGRVDIATVTNFSDFPITVQSFRWYVQNLKEKPNLQLQEVEIDTDIPSGNSHAFTYHVGADQMVIRAWTKVVDPTGREHEEIENNKGAYKTWRSVHGEDYPN